MILKVRHLFQISSSGGNFCIYELHEGLGMRKILAHGYLDSKGCTNQGGHFLDFHKFYGFMELCGGFE